MLTLENHEVVGWDHAIRGMRNPKNSWDRMDSDFDWPEYPDIYKIGPNDHKLMMNLAKGGPVHAKYRRMITVYVDITAPLYWWKEFDTYKVGTVANSCSTMHKIHAKKFEMSDFSTEHLLPASYKALGFTIKTMNEFRELYLAYDDWKNGTVPVSHEVRDIIEEEISKKDLWWQMIQLLPTSYNQKRTVMLNYEVLHNIYISRKDHKLDEWHTFCDWIKELPYNELIIGEEES